MDEVVRGVNRLAESRLFNSGDSDQSTSGVREILTGNAVHKSFQYCELGSLTPTLINAYAKRWLKRQKVGWTRGGRSESHLRGRSSISLTYATCARNPMQLAILLSLIHTRGASLPDKRTALYDSLRGAVLQQGSREEAA